MDALGKTLGSYRAVELIGEGGMGHVYRAIHQRLGRHVALKVLKPELAHRADIARRFLEEARAVNDIRHPQIVDIYDFMEDLSRQPPLVCMVMELLKGESLASYIARRGTLPLGEVVHIARQVTEILDAVHGSLILHRDLKAENIFLLEGPGPKRVKLLDFGSIKSLDEDQQLHLTDPGTALGTPEYMAPEQVLGEKLDQRTDIYAMGIVLYKMLSGSVPFSGPSYGALMVEVLKTKPRPVGADLLGGSTAIPKAVQAVVMRCLQKKPGRRFSSMGELRAALDQAATDALAVSSPSAALANDGHASGPAAAQPVVTAETLAPRRSRGRVAALVLAVALLTAFVLWMATGKRGDGRVAAEPSQASNVGATADKTPHRSLRSENPPADPHLSHATAAIAESLGTNQLANSTGTTPPHSRGERASDERATPAPSNQSPPAAAAPVTSTAAVTDGDASETAAVGGRSRRSTPARQRSRPRATAKRPGARGTSSTPTGARPRSPRPARAESTTVDPFSM